MLIFVQRLSGCVQISFLLCFEELLKPSAQLPREPLTVSVHTGNCVFTVSFDIFLKKAANLNSHRHLNNVPESSTAFREQLSLWCVAPVQRRRLHF